MLVPTAAEEEEEAERLGGTMDFAVTRDFSLMKDAMFLPSSTPAALHRGVVQPKVRKKEAGQDSNPLPPQSNLHELSM